MDSTDNWCVPRCSWLYWLGLACRTQHPLVASVCTICSSDSREVAFPACIKHQLGPLHYTILALLSLLPKMLWLVCPYFYYHVEMDFGT